MSDPQQTAAYNVRIIKRPSMMGRDDYHATVTRNSDGKQLIFISDYLRLLRWKTRRPALDRAFARQARYEESVHKVREFNA